MRPRLHEPSTSPFLYRLKMGPQVQFTHNIKKIKGAANENGNVDGTCKRSFITLVRSSVILLLQKFIFHLLAQVDKWGLKEINIYLNLQS